MLLLNHRKEIKDTNQKGYEQMKGKKMSNKQLATLLLLIIDLIRNNNEDKAIKKIFELVENLK